MIGMNANEIIPLIRNTNLITYKYPWEKSSKYLRKSICLFNNVNSLKDLFYMHFYTLNRAQKTSKN